MGSFGEVIKGESMGYVWLVVNIAVLKLTVFLGKVCGSLLNKLVRNSFFRYGIFFLIFAGLLWGSNGYHRNHYPKNLFRKHGVTRHSSEKQIKDMYRKFARENHPDMNQKAGYSKKDFASVNFEFKVLTHKSLRLQYDKFGEASSEGSIYANMGYKVTSVLGSFLFYLGQGIFLIAFVSDEKSMKIKAGSFYLTVALLLYELFTVFGRTETMKDPLDFVYPDMTLKERLDFIQTTFLGYLFMYVFYKYAFSLSFSTRFQINSGYIMIGIKLIEKEFAEKKANFILSNKQAAEKLNPSNQGIAGAEKDLEPASKHQPDSNPEPQSNPQPESAPNQPSEKTLPEEQAPLNAETSEYPEDPHDAKLQARLKEHFRCVAEYVIAISKVLQEPVEANENRQNAYKGLNLGRAIIDAKKYKPNQPKQPKTASGAPPTEPAVLSDNPPTEETQPAAEEDSANQDGEEAQEIKKPGGILSFVWGLVKSLLWLMAFNLAIRYLLR